MADLPVTPLANYPAIFTPAQSISDTASAAASRGLTQAQATGAEITNQRSKLQLGFLQALVDSLHNGGGDQSAPAADQSGVAPQVGDENGDTHTSIAAAGLDPSHITAMAQRNYAVPDIWTDQERQQLMLASASGQPGATDAIKALHDTRIKNAQARAQLGASKAYDESDAIATAPDGTALSTLAKIHPDAADTITKLAKAHGWDDDQTDQFVRTYANDVGNAVHRYSGREIDIGNDKIARDKVTQRPLLGGNPAGLSADEQAKYTTEAMKPVTVKQGDHEVQMPQWQYAGAPSVQAYINRAAMRDKAQNRQEPGVGNAPAAPPPAAPAAPGAQKVPNAPASTVKDPQLRAALNDSDFDAPKISNTRGVSAGPAAVEQSKALVTARNKLLEDTGFNAKVSGSALVYLNAARKILDNGGAATGFAAEERTTIDRVYNMFGLHLGKDPKENIALTKNLVNAALQNIKATFGPRVTANEVFLNLEKANPSPNMPDTAIRSLVDENADIAKYDIDTAKRANAYVNHGKDATKFDTWNQQYFPREQAVAAAQPAAPKTPKTGSGQRVVKRTGKYQGRAVVQYTDGTIEYK